MHIRKAKIKIIQIKNEIYINFIWYGNKLVNLYHLKYRIVKKCCVSIFNLYNKNT